MVPSDGDLRPLIWAFGRRMLVTMTELAEPVYALLTDGTEVEVRPLCPEDRPAVERLHEGMSPENLYLRFFGFSRSAVSRTCELLCRPPGPGHVSVSVWLDGALVGVAGCEPVRTEAPAEAEIAIAVADGMHHRGVGTLLLEHLGSAARRRGIRVFLAEVLAANQPMLGVAAGAGMAVERRTAAGVVEMRLSLDPADAYLDAVAERERRADVASLAHVLRPASVAVVGAGRNPESVGHAILASLRSGGFEGRVYAVNPHAGPRLLDVPCAATVAGLPEAPELAVLAVPAGQIAATARACGERGVRALVVITAGLDETAGRELRQICHRYGMRLVGPNCLGVADTTVGLDATFAVGHPAAGRAGVVVQSGGVGIALLGQLSRLGLGVSSLVSAGDKYDVSANDLLQWWESDGVTRLGVLHVESFGNPRKFARTARRVARSMPLLTVVAGRSAAGRRAAASHTAAAATPTATQEALFAQAGVVATHGLGELVGAAALLGNQPVPTGPRVAIVSNAGGAGVLAADACTDAGLTVAELGEDSRTELSAMLPATAAVAGPVDTTAAISVDLFRRCVELAAADPGTDAVLLVIAPTAVGELTAALDSFEHAVPVAAVLLDQAESVTVRPSGVPCYAFPEDAARALAHAWSYGRWLARPTGAVPDLGGIDQARGSTLIADFLAREPDGGWLAPTEALALLGCYGLPLIAWRWARTPDEAVAGYAELGGRVVAKASVPGLLHKTEAGAVQLDLNGAADVRRAFVWFQNRFGNALEGVLLQPMEPDGPELLCGVVQEPVFGPLVVCAAGGVSTDLLDDRAVRLTPLTDLDAAQMVRSLRAARLLSGAAPGLDPADLGAVENVLLRLARLADDHPEISEVDLNPVILHRDGAVAVDARVKVVPARPFDPYLRRLR